MRKRIVRIVSTLIISSLVCNTAGFSTLAATDEWNYDAASEDMEESIEAEENTVLTEDVYDGAYMDTSAVSVIAAGAVPSPMPSENPSESPSPSPGEEPGTEPSATPSTAPALVNPRKDMNENTVWDCVWFGEYWQNDTNKDGTADVKDAKEPVKWRVLSVEGDKALLLADKNLDCKPYNTSWTEVTWENSTIRSWLNGYGADSNINKINYETDNFIDIAFTSNQKSAIVKTELKNADNGGNNTTDLIFFLSLDDVKNTAYGFDSDVKLYDKARYALNTEFAKAQGAFNIQDGNGYWWLRTSGSGLTNISFVHEWGYVDTYGCPPSGDEYGNFNAIRPALYLDLSSVEWNYAGTVTSDGTVEETYPNDGTSVYVYAADKIDLTTYKLTGKEIKSYQVQVDGVITKKYATISKKGILTAKKSGNLVVEALDADKNVIGSMNIIVCKPYFEKAAIPVLTKPGQQLDVSSYLKDVPENGYTLSWETTSKLGTVDSQKGLLSTAAKSGKVTVTAVFTNAAGKKYKVRISITLKFPKHTVKPVTVKATRYKTLQVTNLAGQNVSWKTSNPEVASVIMSEKSTAKTAKAKVTGNNTGTAVITATIEGVEYSFTVNVK